MAKGKGKGSTFERSVAKQLSSWWTEGSNPDCLWRSAMSGGKATVTGSSVGAGDLVAVAPEGNRLVELVCFELKRGYPSADFYSIVESKKPSKVVVDFIKQASDSAKLGKTHMWSIIHKRDRKEAMIYFEGGFYEDLDSLIMNFVMNIDSSKASLLNLWDGKSLHVCGCKLETFLLIPPAAFADRVERNVIIGDN